MTVDAKRLTLARGAGGDSAPPERSNERQENEGGARESWLRTGPERVARCDCEADRIRSTEVAGSTRKLTV